MIITVPKDALDICNCTGKINDVARHANVGVMDIVDDVISSIKRALHREAHFISVSIGVIIAIIGHST